MKLPHLHAEPFLTRFGGTLLTACRVVGGVGVLVAVERVAWIISIGEGFQGDPAIFKLVLFGFIAFELAEQLADFGNDGFLVGLVGVLHAETVCYFLHV